MFWTRGLFVALCAAICLAVSGAGVASAGEYHVYSCRMPNGEAAPTDGWSGSATGAAASAESTCTTGGALVARLGDGTTHEVDTDHATWTFSAPAQTTITGAKLHVQVTLMGDGRLTRRISFGWLDPTTTRLKRT